MDAVTALTAWLWQGPAAARVDSMHIEQWRGATPRDFAVF
jgi:hypothetical protein